MFKSIKSIYCLSIFVTIFTVFSNEKLDSININNFINARINKSIKERRVLDSLYNEINKLNNSRSSYYYFHMDSNEQKETNDRSVQYKILEYNWRHQYPVQAFIYDNKKSSQRRRRLFVTIGTFQILSGISSLIFTIVDVNKTKRAIKKYETELNKDKKSIDVKSWSPIHTTMTIISSGFFVSGIITISFK